MYRLCTIKNDEEGRVFIKTLREQMKNCGKHVKLRGRGHRLGVQKYRQDLPLANATSFAVYVGRRWVKRLT